MIQNVIAFRGLERYAHVLKTNDLFCFVLCLIYIISFIKSMTLNRNIKFMNTNRIKRHSISMK